MPQLLKKVSKGLFYLLVMVFLFFLPMLLVFMAVFTAYSVNAILDEKDMLYANKVGEELKQDEVWEEEKFRFSIEKIEKVPKNDFFPNYSDKENLLACQLIISLELENGFEVEEEKFELSVTGYDSANERLSPSPLPDKLVFKTENSKKQYIFLIPENIHYAKLMVILSDGNDVYKKIYKVDLENLIYERN